MAVPGTCPECGASLPVAAPHGLCPRCLLAWESLALSQEELAELEEIQTETRTVAVPILSTEKVGDKIGRYKLLQKLGEGGCGIVYMAEQQEPVKRRVALKVIKLGMDTKEVIARFEAERQALALMDHPNIAKVLDAGSTEAGRPYFVMELVRGISITRYCDENRVTTLQRLELFIVVCQAVQHAHQKGIIHRDIKPSNVLVADHDGVPVPKVIDFGIAKATGGQTLTDKTLFTAFEQFIGTPAYMSPEQAKLSGLDIDTRSDVYSLGVLLYELLTGKTPFESKRLVQAGIEEICRIIREEEPPRPSTRLSTLEAAEQTTVARQRQIEAPKLVHLIHGDLDWIVMKTLEKDRNRRYETSNALASDLRRYINQEPVLARPPSNFYRFQKLVRRNKVIFGAIAAVIVALAVGFGLSTWLFLKERATRRQVASEASKSRQVAQFLKDMLDGVGPSVAKGRDTAMLREILNKTAERVGKELKNQPDVQAELLTTMGGVYELLSEYDKEESAHRQALALRQSLFGPFSPDVAASLANVGSALVHRGKLAEAEPVLRESLAMRRKLLGDHHLDVAESLYLLGPALYEQRKLSEAEGVLRESLAIQRASISSRRADVVSTISFLSVVVRERGKLDEAESLGREAAARGREIWGEDNPSLAITMRNLADVLLEKGQLNEAEKFYRDALTIQRKTLGHDHQQLAGTLNNLSRALYRQNKFREAEAAGREALPIMRKVYGASHSDLAAVLDNLAMALQAQNKVTEAEPMLRESLTISRKIFGAESSSVADVLTDLGWLYDKAAKWDDAETSLREALRICEKLQGTTNTSLWESEYALAHILMEQGKLSEAQAIQLRALDRVRAGLPKELRQEVPALGLILHHQAEVLRLKKELTEARSVAQSALDMYYRHWDWSSEERFHAAYVLGWVLIDLGEFPAASALCRDQLKELRPDGSLIAYWLETTNDLQLSVEFHQLGVALVRDGKFDEAEWPVRQALGIREKYPDQWQAFNTRSLLGACLSGNKRYAEAQPLLLSGYEGLMQRIDQIPPVYRANVVAEAIHRLVQLYEAEGAADNASKWRERETASHEAYKLPESNIEHARR